MKLRREQRRKRQCESIRELHIATKREAKWKRLQDQLADKFENLLPDWTLEICCFEEELGLPEILTKHKKSEFFRKWYPISKLDTWEEVIKREIKGLHLESWCKMTEREKIKTFIVNLMDIFQKEGSINEYRYFGNEKTTEILENLPEEIKRFYVGRSGHHGEWLCLWNPLLKKFAEKNKGQR